MFPPDEDLPHSYDEKYNISFRHNDFKTNSQNNKEKVSSNKKGL